MNTPPHHDPQQPDVFLRGTQTPPSRPLPASKNSKRVCFHKSGDPSFSGHWVVINSRTFKTFDALLDALSNKVPLPFGVRTITTPKGTRAIRSLDDLQHGASYVCSDQRKVKPLNPDKINRRHVPWNSTRPTSAERHGRRGLIRQMVRKNEAGRMANMAESSVTVRTPKRLVVFKNRDPSSKRIVVLQRRTAPTYEALLEYLSQVMQFPVVKLYTTDGRRVEGLPALILCSGVIVAAGNEPFQQANFKLHASAQPSRSVISETTGSTKKQPPVQQNLTSSRPRSRNFSLSSERYFVNQINMSLNESRSSDVKMGSTVSVNNQALESEEIKNRDLMTGLEEKDCVIIPSEDEIEKSFRVNHDGSMTVEMKVRLTIKQEEMIRWTTTVSRAGVNSQKMAAFSQPISNYNSVDNKDNNNNRTRKSKFDGYESKGVNTQIFEPNKLNKQGECGSVIYEAFEKKHKARFRRLPTPGPRRVRRKETSVENIKRPSQTEVQKSTGGAYSHIEHTAESELSEGYCVVSHSSSSSARPVPKARKKNLGKVKCKKTHSSLSGMAEVLQLHNKGTEITETITHIHQSQDTRENSTAKSWDGEDGGCELTSQEHKKPAESRPQSSRNDCDTDLRKQSVSSGSGNARNNKLLSIVSSQSCSSQTISNNASSCNDYEIHARCETSEKGVETSTKEDFQNKMTDKRVLLRSIVKDKKQNSTTEDFFKNLKYNNSPESHRCTESGRQKVKKRWKIQSPKINALHSNSLMDQAQRHSDMQRLLMKERLDMIPSSHSAPFIILTKQRSGNGSIKKTVKKCKELSESVSTPVLHSSPCNVHQYVKNWLEKIHPESIPYMDELNPHESRARFQIESDFSDVSEMIYESEENSAPMNKTMSRQPVKIGCEGEPVETQHLRRSKSMPSVRIHAPEKKIGARQDKSLEELISKLPDTGGNTSPNTQLNHRSGMKQVLEQLCSSVLLFRRAFSDSHLSSLEKMKKSSSLPDFSSMLSSVFGSPSKSLLSLLTVMTLRDGIFNYANKKSGFAKANNSSSNPEALQVMQSIQNLTKIENEEELQSSLVNLHSSTSAQLKRSWRDFQKTNDIKKSPCISPRHSEFNREEDVQDKERSFGIKEVMDELNMCEDLRREVSLLVRNEWTRFGRAKPTKEHSGLEKETTNVARENVDDLGSFLKGKARHLEKNQSQSADIITTKTALLSAESEDLQLLESSPHNPALLSNALVVDESDLKTVQIEDMINQKGLVIAYKSELVDDVKTSQEWVLENEPNQADLCEEKKMMDNVHMIDERNTEDEISQVDEVQASDYSLANLKDKVKWEEDASCMQSESELLSPSSGTEAKNVRSNSEVIVNHCKRADFTDSLEGCGVNVKEEHIYCETRGCLKQPDVISVASEIDTVEERHPNNGTIQTEEKDAMYNESAASDFSVDEADPQSHNDNNHNESNNDLEETTCSTSKCENPTAELHHSSASDQEIERSDHKSPSCTWHESDPEYELQKSEEENVKHFYNAKHNDEEADSNEHFDAESNPLLQLDQEDEYLEPYKGHEVVTEIDLQTLEEKNVSKNLTHPAEEKDDGTDKHDGNQSNALDTDKDLDTQSHHCLEGASFSDFLNWESCKSEEKHKAQQDSSGKEESDMDNNVHILNNLCPNTVFPQQLLDFLNLALKSSALIFTYDPNGFLRIEPDRCKQGAMSSSKSDVDNHNVRGCLPSPNTSDLSDYRPDTSDSGGDLLQDSTDLLTESGEDEAERQVIYRSHKTKTQNDGSKKPYSLKQIARPDLKILNSPASVVDTSVQDQIFGNSSDSFGNSELAQCPAFNAKNDSGEGILIDKGRWLLKENHLIRKSPPVPMGMYENGDTTSVDTGQENTSEDAPYAPCGRKTAPLAASSSSELEDMTKPSTPKCTYFNMVHSSDSDPLLDNQNITSNKGRGFTRKSKEVSPLGETSKTLPKKNGSLPSFTSVDFKLAAGKVYPEDSGASSVEGESARSPSVRCNTAHEEEPVQSLSLRCGQHCPIL
ncbi:LOW QUALITY PROTEIN: oxygen-regulated protein 1 [Silurus meridionalis]|uniref:LOW QUALITY PROTEIN: oxygen-regulated protein 1 n=1 Tax=Silurus meridionalis TaxID=175797 RepID=UPI001EEAA52F|nr:LOW QUALITY PROTEIN: oxygen-regulated protein 1 [Silurus meridionalis]